jgi:hypothetical protein
MAILIAYVVPCLLRQVSLRRCREALRAGAASPEGGPSASGPLDAAGEALIKTAYHSAWSTDAVSYALMAIGAALVLYVFVQNVKS